MFIDRSFCRLISPRQSFAAGLLVFALVAPAALGQSQCPGEGSCCEPNGTPGCSDEKCCFDICFFIDASCCEVEWDQACVDATEFFCTFCDDPLDCPGEGSCFEPNGTPSCNDETCCINVCEIDSVCCEEEWDAVCVKMAFEFCDAPCVFCPDGTTPENDPTCVLDPSPVVPAENANVFYSGFAANDRLGQTVAIIDDVDSDGFDDVLAGAYTKTVGGAPNTGRVYAFSGLSGEIIWSAAGEAQGDQFGFSVAGIGDVNADGFEDVVVGARFNDAGGANAGRVYALSGDDGAVIWTFTGGAGDEAGTAVSRTGDIGGPGFDDVVVGAPGTLNASGQIYVVTGADGALFESDSGDNPGDLLGFSVAGLGDFNSDGVADYAAGAFQADNNGTNSGVVYVYCGATGRRIITLTDGMAGDEFGISVADAGDVDNDGFADLIVGARFSDAGSGDPDDNRGQAYIYSGPFGVLLQTLTGEQPGDQFGFATVGIGDVNGDMNDDVLVGAIAAGPGKAEAFSGADGSLLYSLVGENNGDQFGVSLAGNGDINNNGQIDVLVGARFNDAVANNAGRTYAFFDRDGSFDDPFNGGCFSSTPNFTPLLCGQTYCGTASADPRDGQRDLDWYQIQLSSETLLTIEVDVGFEAEIGIIDSEGDGDCSGIDQLEFLTSVNPAMCGEETLEVSLPAGTWWLVVAPDQQDLTECDTSYLLSLQCGEGVDECGDPGAGSCLENNGTPFCDDQTCCEMVCAIQPGCCDTQWDDFCAVLADEECTLSDACPSPGDCFEAHDNPGCENTTCCNIVCMKDSFCCDFVWDGTCAGQAISLCGDGCDLVCPAGAMQEFEPDCGLDDDGNSDDTTNGGCNSSPPVFDSIECGQTVCGTSAFNASTSFRDTDWYQIDLAVQSEVTLTVTAEFPAQIGIVDNSGTGDCDDVDGFVISEITGLCDPTSVTACLPAGEWWLFIAPDTSSPVTCGATYIAEVNCSTPCTVTECGDAGTGDCFSANATPFCNDQACCETVCDDQPFCCNQKWDQMCADLAAVLCNKNPLENDECSGAIDVATGEFAFSTLNATIGDPLLPADCSGSITQQTYGPDIWYRHTATCDGTLFVSTCQTADFDTGIAVYTGNCNGLEFVDCNDDAFLCGTTSTLPVEVQCGQEYLIRVYGSFPDDVGEGMLSFECEGNRCPGGGNCPEDLDGDGNVGGGDLGLLLGNFNAGGTGDINNDGIVDGGDLGQLLGAFGPCSVQTCPEDLDGDGVVGGGDLGLLLGNFNGSGTGDINNDGNVDGGDLGQLLGAFGPCS